MCLYKMSAANKRSRGKHGVQFYYLSILLSVRSSGLKVASGADINITKSQKLHLYFKLVFQDCGFDNYSVRKIN